MLFDPMWNVISPVYVPASRFALEAMMLMSCRFPVPNVPLAEPSANHCLPLLVDADPDQVPVSPQLLMVTVCNKLLL